MSMSAVQIDPQAPAVAESETLRRGTAQWLGKGFWSMVDMGLFAGGNFLTHIFLARWLPEETYGAFTTAFAIYLLFAVVHTSVLVEPMMVYGSQRYHRRLPGYLGNLVRLHTKMCGVYALVALAIAGVGIALGKTELAYALFVFAAAQFTLLLPWVLRDACYINADPRPAGIAGVIYVGSVLAGLAGLRWAGGLSLPTAVAVLGVAALLASAWLIYVLQLTRNILHATPRWQHARTRHWRFGRWALTTNFIRYVPEHLPMVLVPAVMGYASGGALKAMVNLIMPFVLVTWALSLLMLPVLVRRKGTPQFEVFAVRVALLAMAGPLVCWPLLGAFGEPLMDLLYEGKFMDHAWVLWVLGALPVLVSLNCILFAMFRALDRPGLLLPGAVTSAVSVAVIGFPLMWFFGLGGMALGMLLAQLVNGVIQVYFYASRLRDVATGQDKTQLLARHGQDDAERTRDMGLVPVVQEMVS